MRYQCSITTKSRISKPNPIPSPPNFISLNPSIILLLQSHTVRQVLAGTRYSMCLFTNSHTPRTKPTNLLLTKRPLTYSPTGMQYSTTTLCINKYSMYVSFHVKKPSQSKSSHHQLITIITTSSPPMMKSFYFLTVPIKHHKPQTTPSNLLKHILFLSNRKQTNRNQPYISRGTVLRSTTY
jgi:hypothetical protein